MAQPFLLYVYFDLCEVFKGARKGRVYGNVWRMRASEFFCGTICEKVSSVQKGIFCACIQKVFKSNFTQKKSFEYFFPGVKEEEVQGWDEDINSLLSCFDSMSSSTFNVTLHIIGRHRESLIVIVSYEYVQYFFDQQFKHLSAA